MKAIILAGGLGSRLSEETTLRPKPMVEIGGKPILWHIMNIFSCYGVDEFIVALGYRGEVIKEYFLNFYAANNNITVDLATGGNTIHEGRQPRWKVHLVDTGAQTQTGGRVKRLEKWLGDDETFMMTYGDGVADVDIRALLKFHQTPRQTRDGHHRPSARALRRHRLRRRSRGRVHGETPDRRRLDQRRLLRPRPPRAAVHRRRRRRCGSASRWNVWRADGQLMAYRHNGFWQPMDTLRERKLLEDLWAAGNAPWKCWK